MTCRIYVKSSLIATHADAPDPYALAISCAKALLKIVLGVRINKGVAVIRLG